MSTGKYIVCGWVLLACGMLAAEDSFVARMEADKKAAVEDLIRLDAFLTKYDAQAKAKQFEPAQDVMFPIEFYPDGRIKSRLQAERAMLFADTGIIWAEGIALKQYEKDGVTETGFLTATNCVVDRVSKTGWTRNDVDVQYGKIEFKGRGVYFSFPQESIRIYYNSDIKISGMKVDVGRIK